MVGIISNKGAHAVAPSYVYVQSYSPSLLAACSFQRQLFSMG
jgi:hypothetical protein